MHVRCTMSLIRSICIRFSGCIKSSKIVGMHTIRMRPNAIQIIAMKTQDFLRNLNFFLIGVGENTFEKKIWGKTQTQAWVWEKKLFGGTVWLEKLTFPEKSQILRKYQRLWTRSLTKGWGYYGNLVKMYPILELFLYFYIDLKTT